MMSMLRKLYRDKRGSMAIETALVAPVLMALAMGGFEVSAMVARQSELQSAAAEAAAVARAVIPDTTEKQNTVRDIVATSVCNGTSPTISEAGAATCETATVTITPKYRCGIVDDYTTVSNCPSDTEYQFISVTIQDNYTPLWTQFGVGTAMNFNITRTVQIG